MEGIRDTIVAVQPSKCVVACELDAKSIAWDPKMDARGKIFI